MDEICEIRDSISISGIKAKKDVHSEQVKDNKRLWDDLDTRSLLIDNFKNLQIP